MHARAVPCSERGNATLKGRGHRCHIRPLNLALNTDKKSSRSHTGWQILVRGDEGHTLLGGKTPTLSWEEEARLPERDGTGGEAL